MSPYIPVGLLELYMKLFVVWIRPVYTLVIFEVSPPTSDEQLGILAVVSQKFPNDEIR